MTSPAIVRQTQFLVALAEAGIEPDIQELLVAGNPSRGIAPGALAKALAALDAAAGEGEAVEDADLATALDNLGFALRFDAPAGKEWRHTLSLAEAIALHSALSGSVVK